MVGQDYSDALRDTKMVDNTEMERKTEWDLAGGEAQRFIVFGTLMASLQWSGLPVQMAAASRRCQDKCQDKCQD
jgi:hypothetical protein